VPSYKDLTIFQHYQRTINQSNRDQPVHGDMILLSDISGDCCQAKRLPLGDTQGRNETWIRDNLFAHPGILPIAEISLSFDPMKLNRSP
jgi:hypothetical protein